jgi:hypothetical protein
MVPIRASGRGRRTIMGKSQWLVAVSLALVASAALAEDKGSVYIAPYAGGTHLRIDSGRVYNEAETIRFDSLQVGFTLGYRAPFGMLVEVGRSNAIHADIFDEHGDYELTQSYGAIGWQFAFADGWHIAPRVGRGRWELGSDHRVLLDGAGVRHYEVQGWDNFWEVALMRDVNSVMSLGVNFKDVDQEFGHSRTGEFLARFRF